jgi:hypothetical protein
MKKKKHWSVYKNPERIPNGSWGWRLDKDCLL